MGKELLLCEGSVFPSWAIRCGVPIDATCSDSSDLPCRLNLRYAKRLRRRPSLPIRSSRSTTHQTHSERARAPWTSQAILHSPDSHATRLGRPRRRSGCRAICATRLESVLHGSDTRVSAHSVWDQTDSSLPSMTASMTYAISTARFFQSNYCASPPKLQPAASRFR
jgi:hypothetical protein